VMAAIKRPGSKCRVRGHKGKDPSGSRGSYDHALSKPDCIKTMLVAVPADSVSKKT